MFIPVTDLIDTVLGWIEEQRVVYETIINRYYVGRQLSTFAFRRSRINVPDMPAIEVDWTSEDPGWKYFRVLSERTALEIDVTTNHHQPELAGRCEAELVSLTARILASPPHLQAAIRGIDQTLWNSIPTGVSHRVENEMRIATLSWTGERLEYLVNMLFSPTLQVPQPIEFPPL
jgi:hypothetical protein